jgi:hypothetical protein
MGKGGSDTASHTLVKIVDIGSEERDGAKSAHKQRESIEAGAEPESATASPSTNQNSAPNWDKLQLN